MTEGTTEKSGASKLARLSWSFYDWAAQPYHTIISTFVFFPYFAATFIGDPVRGQAIVGYTLGAAGLLVALLSPVVGSIADASGPRKPWILGFSIVFVPAISLLWFAEPGALERLPLIIAAIIIATMALEIAAVFYNAMLPTLAPKSQIGGLSGFAWGLGYVGGLISLSFVLIYLALPGEMEAPFIPDTPLFGLSSEHGEPDRMTGPLTGLWYLLFALPLFLFVPDQKPSGISLTDSIGKGTRQLLNTLKDLPSYGNVLRFLLARMIYNDGLLAVFSFGGIYAAGLFGWSITMLGIFGIILVVFSAVGAFLGGWLDQSFGSKPTLYLALTLLAAGILGIISIGNDTVLWIITVEPYQTGGAPFSSAQEQFYLVCGILLGMAAGPIQAASRTMMARLAPEHMMAEFFGLFAFSGRVTSFAAPLAIGFVTDFYQTQQAGLFVILGFTLAGLVLLIPVKETSPQLSPKVPTGF